MGSGINVRVKTFRDDEKTESDGTGVLCVAFFVRVFPTSYSYVSWDMDESFGWLDARKSQTGLMKTKLLQSAGSCVQCLNVDRIKMAFQPEIGIALSRVVDRTENYGIVIVYRRAVKTRIPNTGGFTSSPSVPRTRRKVKCRVRGFGTMSVLRDFIWCASDGSIGLPRALSRVPSRRAIDVYTYSQNKAHVGKSSSVYSRCVVLEWIKDAYEDDVDRSSFPTVFWPCSRSAARRVATEPQRR